MNRIEYVESDLKTILDRWARDFKPTDKKEHIFNYETFVDNVKGTVIFRLYLTDNDNLHLPNISSN